jgi:hypothetical protein
MSTNLLRKEIEEKVKNLNYTMTELKYLETMCHERKELSPNWEINLGFVKNEIVVASLPEDEANR